MVIDWTLESWDTTRTAVGRSKIGGEPVAMTFAPEKRAGFLSLPSFMMNLSTFTQENKVVQRGRWVRENLLCKPVPELPIGSVPPLPEGNMTLRAKLKIHSSMPGCVACHKFMDPFGLVFEGHDDLGRTITKDHGGPVDESGGIVDLSPQLDGPVVGISQLTSKLATSTEVEMCFVRQNMRYLLGRYEEISDGCTIMKAQAAYTAAGGDYAALMNSLLSSDSFLFRKGVKP
jgi:hypothetical protein